jgi:hypothetical protein
MCTGPITVACISPKILLRRRRLGKLAIDRLTTFDVGLID